MKNNMLSTVFSVPTSWLSVMVDTSLICVAQDGSHSLCVATKNLKCGYFAEGPEY